MPTHHRSKFLSVLSLGVLAIASPTAAGSPEAAFLAENDAAMSKMHREMHVPASGDVDRDFVDMMVPHHQGAIDMAQAVLRYGKNEKVRRLAQEIIVSQQEEIAAMRLAVGQPLPALTAAPTQPAANSEPLPPAAATEAMPAISHHDRVYAAEQFSNTVSVTDPVDNKLLGVIKLGDPAPGNFSPLYKGQVLVHGLGFSPDHKTLAVVSIASNSVTFVDTATNAVKHTTYIGRSPHEAFYAPSGKEVWVTVRGENYVSVIDANSFAEKQRITLPAGPGMTIFSPDGKLGYVCSSFNPETSVIDVATHKVVGKVAQASPFCPNIAAAPDGKSVWLTLKDVGKVMAFEAKAPFKVLTTIETGPITNHVNFARTAAGQFAYVTIGGKNEVQVFKTDDFTKIATIPVGALPHGLWPSGDGTRMYVGLENDDALAVIDTAAQKVVANVPIGQAPQALVYVPNAVPTGDGAQNLVPLGVAGQVARLSLTAPGAAGQAAKPQTSVSLFDQGLVQMLQASVTGLQPKQPYVLALAMKPDGQGTLQPLAAFNTNPAGAGIVNAIGPIRQVVNDDRSAGRRYLVIASGTPTALGPVVQVQAP